MHRLFLSIALTLTVATAHAETASILILHTNDLHDHLRADSDGTGGMAYVSSYIRSVKDDRSDVIALDAGDVMEKGDIVAYRTQSALMYEAMNRAQIDAGAPGNHDDAYGLDTLVQYAKENEDLDILCINWFDEVGELILPPSKIYERNGLKIGVIGMARPRDVQSLDDVESARAIAEEAARLDEECHLVIVTCHASRQYCRDISPLTPNVDVFVSGHTHEALKKPVIVEKTGAIILQAGSYAEYVGRLELEVDLESEEISITDGRLVTMNHDTIEPDQWMVDWLKEHEARLAPEADRVIFENTERLGSVQLGLIGAAAYREAAGAEIGFLHAGQVIRDSLPPGPATMNAIFRTGGQRGYDVIRARVSGFELNAYLNTLTRKGWGATTWSGFHGSRKKIDGVRQYTTDLDPEKYYDVVMSLKEWDTRFMRSFEREFSPVDDAQAKRIAALSPTPTDIHFTEAVAAYIAARPEIHADVKGHAATLDESNELP